MTKKLNQERLKQVLKYEPESGVFTWKCVRSSALVGCVAGHTSKQTGYRIIGVDGCLFLAHRLAWMYMHGEFPPNSIDHIDRNRQNNSICNLRPATQSQNAFNSTARSTNKSGFKGVSWCSSTRKWRSTAMINGKQKSLGRYTEIEDAASAYKAFSEVNHGDYAATELGVTFYDLMEH